MHEATYGGTYDLIQQDQAIPQRAVVDFLHYLQFTDRVESRTINSQLQTRGIMHTPGYTWWADAVLELIHFLHARLTQKAGHDTSLIYTTEFITALQQQVDHIQVLAFWPAAQSVVVDFTHNVMETIVQDGNSIERTFVQRQWKIDAVLQNEALSPEEKKWRLQEVLETWLTNAPIYINALLGKLRSYIPELDVQSLPSPRKLFLAAAVAGSLLYTTQTNKISLQEVAALDEKAWKEAASHPDELRSLVATAKQKSASQKETLSSKKPISDVKKDKTEVTAHEQKKTVIKHWEERPLAEFTPLPQQQIKEVFSSAPKNMKRLDVSGYTLYRDPVSGVFYRQVQSGQTIGELRSVLAQDERFSYLEGSTYKPHSSGNVHSRNIQADKLQVGQLVPIPLDREATALTYEELMSSTTQALTQIQNHKRYGAFVQSLIEKVGEKQLSKVMCAVAKKESSQWSTSMYRYEPGHGRFSYGIYHVLDSWPGRTALQQLGFSSGQVMTDPIKAWERFRAYCYEKFADMQYTKDYKRYVTHPEKLFTKRGLEKFGKLYNGGADYGEDLKQVYNELK